MAEIAIVFGVCLVSEGIAALLPFTFPASVISMILLLALLLSGIIKERHIDRVCRFFVGNMAFFFIPPAWASSSTRRLWPPVCFLSWSSPF